MALLITTNQLQFRAAVVLQYVVCKVMCVPSEHSLALEAWQATQGVNLDGCGTWWGQPCWGLSPWSTSHPCDSAHPA